jgi:hypothetical protein
MTNIRSLVVFLSMLLVAGLILATSRLATAEGIVNLRTTLIFDGALDRDLSRDNPAVQYVSHNLCGISLGGYCPRGYRGCIRAGRPKAECEDRLEQCEACNQAMVQCRQKSVISPDTVAPSAEKLSTNAGQAKRGSEPRGAKWWKAPIR